MFLGHYGLALGAKRLAPQTSLGTLILAAQLADQIWPILLLAGVERVRVVPGLTAVTPLDFEAYPFTHSLLTGTLGGAMAGILYFLLRRYARGAWVVGTLVVSHWMLDLVVHRPDLPVWPGGPRVGLGLWESVPLTLVAEGAVLGIGLYFYLRTTVAIDRVGAIAFWSMLGLLVVIYASSVWGPPPPGSDAVAWSCLLLWLFVPWGYWVDRHRTIKV
jgi:hypothetical protein